jgi:hypothetical protein
LPLLCEDIYIDTQKPTAYILLIKKGVYKKPIRETCLSPTIFTKNGYRFFFYANESNEPPHVHVQYHDAVAKFRFNPVSLAKNMGMTSAELSKAFFLVSNHEKTIMERWNGFFSSKKNK